MNIYPPKPASQGKASMIALSAAQQTLGSSIAFTSPPTTATTGNALSLAGTVSPSATAVQVALGSSSTVAPTSGWVSATVSGGGWTASITPSTSGTFYLWAQQTATPSVSAVSGAVTVSVGNSIALTSPPTSGTANSALTINGTVSTSAAVRVGLSTTNTTAPTSWTAATVSGTSWTVSITPTSAGTYYIWAELTGEPSVQGISAAVTIGAGGAPLTFSVISGSGNGGLSGATVALGNEAVNFTSAIPVGSTSVVPDITISGGSGTPATAKFWWDTTSTGTTVGATYGNSAGISGGQFFYYSNATEATPTGAPAAPSTAGTYYGKWAVYDSTSTLLGVITTSAITVS